MELEPNQKLSKWLAIIGSIVGGYLSIYYLMEGYLTVFLIFLITSISVLIYFVLDYINNKKEKEVIKNLNEINEKKEHRIIQVSDPSKGKIIRTTVTRRYKTKRRRNKRK